MSITKEKPDNIVEMDVQWNVIVPVKLKRSMKAIAAARGVKLEVVAREALEFYIEKNGSPSFTRMVSKVRSLERAPSKNSEIIACGNIISLVQPVESQAATIASAGNFQHSTEMIYGNQVLGNMQKHESLSNIIELKGNGSSASGEARGFRRQQAA